MGPRLKAFVAVLSSLTLSAFLPCAALAASGATEFVIGASTPANTAVLLASTAVSYWGVKIASGTANDFVKCTDSNTTSGFNMGADANLDTVVMSSSTQAGSSVIANFVSAADALFGFQPVATANGVVCAKSGAGDIVYVKTSK